MSIRWRYSIIAGLVLAAFSLYPQARMIYNRGFEWNGHFAYNDVDEAAYAAYLEALIEGRPRKNDPYSGRDDEVPTPKAESIFSIQFAAPYAIALPARVIGIKADLAMVIAGVVAAFATGVIIFWVAAMITGDSIFSFAAALAVVAFGTLAAGEGAVKEIFFGEISYPFLPGFRRYVPAVAFPVFFAFCGMIWRLTARGFSETDTRIGGRFGKGSVLLAVILFAFLLFSYLYLWTAAAAVLLAIIVLTLIFRPDEWLRSSLNLVTLALACSALLLPYGLLVSRRAGSIDTYQMLANSHAADLFRTPEIVAILAAAVLALGAAIGRVKLRGPKPVFVLSLVAAVFVMFNQQILTGISLQPIHYQVFAANYVTVLALILAIWMLAASDEGKFPRVAAIFVAALAVAWGGVECELNSRVLDETNLKLDAAMPVFSGLRYAAAADPALANSTVLVYDLPLADKLPAEAPQNVLWARHQAVFSSLSREESERRFFCYLYYLDVDGPRLARLLKTDFVTVTALFGWDRHTDRLSVDARPLWDTEIRAEVSKYERFRRSFSISDASDPKLSFVIAPDGFGLELTALRQWYDLTELGSAGGNTLYRASLLETERTPPGN